MKVLLCYPLRNWFLLPALSLVRSKMLSRVMLLHESLKAQVLFCSFTKRYPILEVEVRYKILKKAALPLVYSLPVHIAVRRLLYIGLACKRGKTQCQNVAGCHVGSSATSPRSARACPLSAGTATACPDGDATETPNGTKEEIET